MYEITPLTWKASSTNEHWIEAQSISGNFKIITGFKTKATDQYGNVLAYDEDMERASLYLNGNFVHRQSGDGKVEELKASAQKIHDDELKKYLYLKEG